MTGHGNPQGSSKGSLRGRTEQYNRSLFFLGTDGDILLLQTETAEKGWYMLEMPWNFIRMRQTL